jgi:hypothetical protein
MYDTKIRKWHRKKKKKEEKTHIQQTTEKSIIYKL